jgi:hypothetical protein
MNQHGIFEGDEFSPTKNVFHSNLIAARSWLKWIGHPDLGAGNCIPERNNGDYVPGRQRLS